MVLGGFAVPTKVCSFSLFYQYPKKNYISLDSQRRMLYHDINYVNLSNEIRVCTKREPRNCNFLYIFLN